MSNRVVKVGRGAMAACMTCPICNKLFRDATTIPECLHTFCRKCIHKKLSDEELESCPICNIDLGIVPLEKLRPDHNLQDVRAKIFPLKRKRVKAPEVVPSVTLPFRRKERSLSSLVVSTPVVSTQTAMTGKRSKAKAKKKSRGSSFSAEEPLKKEENSIDDLHESSSSRETLYKLAHNLRLKPSTAEEPLKKEENSIDDLHESSSSRETLYKVAHNLRLDRSSAEQSSQRLPDKLTKSGAESSEGKVNDLWKPLNDLVEVANRSKSSKAKVKGQSQRSKVLNEKDDAKELSNLVMLQKNYKRQSGGSGESSVTTLPAVGDANANNAGMGVRKCPVWFELVPSEQQEGEPLGKMDGRFIKLENGNVPVTLIQKRVMIKFGLSSESEVELKCLGQPVDLTLTVSDLLEWWLQRQPSKKIVPRTGAPAEKFIMKITYTRKAPAA